MVEIHLEQLMSLPAVSLGKIGKNVLKFASSIDSSIDWPKWMDTQMCRESLLSKCADNQISNRDTFVAAMAWGGMQKRHAIPLLRDHWHKLNGAINLLRTGSFDSREDAFREFQSLRSLGAISHMGIAYFTKLICFFQPQLNGYILDQWTAKSCNLLIGQNLVKLTGNWVNDKNTPRIYNEFCGFIDDLAIVLNCSGLKAEERIYSKGYNVGEWRKYVKSMT